MMRYPDLSMRSGGIISRRCLGRILTKNLGNLVIENLPKPFITVATELAKGHKI